MSECTSETSDITKQSTNCIDSDSILQEPPRKKIKKESVDDTENELPHQSTSNEDDQLFNLVPDTEPANYMTYLLSLPQDPASIEPIELQSLEPVEEIPTFSSQIEETADITPQPTKRLESVEKSPVVGNNIEITIDGRSCVLDLEKAQDMLAALHEMYPGEMEAVIHARNEWGELFLGRCINQSNNASKTPHESQLQKCFQNWLTWNLKKYDPTRTPFCYKCYICNEAWWTLEEFRNHIVIHPKCFLEAEAVLRECNIIAYEGDKPEHKEIRIYNNCLKCGKGYDYHVSHKYQWHKAYSCDYCNKEFVTCTAANRHMTICPKSPMFVKDSGSSCQVCQARFPTDPDLSKHLSMSHSVRSDDPIVSLPRTCPICNEMYFLKMYHICWKQEFKFCCQYCHRKFQCYNSLNKHLEVWNDPSQCQHCEIKMPKKCLIREHYIRYHCEHFVIVYQCPLCLDIKIFLSLEMAEDHMKVDHSGKRYCTVVMPKAMLIKNVVKLPETMEEKKSLPVSSESTGRSLSQNRTRGQPMEKVKVFAPALIAFDKVTSENRETTSKKGKIAVNNMKKDRHRKDRSKIIEQLNEHVDLTPDVIAIKEEVISDDDTETSKDSESDDGDAEIISDSESENDIETVKDSQPGMSTVFPDPTTEVVTDSESDDNALIISDSKPDGDTDDVRSSESGVCKIVQEPTTEVTKVSDSDDDVVETIESEPRISKVVSIPTAEAVAKDDDDNHGESDTPKVLQDPNTFTDEVKNKELLEAASLLKEETVALQKVKNKFLIVLDSTDDEGDDMPIKDARMLKAGYKKIKTYRCARCGFTAYHKEYREHMASFCKKTKRSKDLIIEEKYKCTRCKIGFPTLKKYGMHLKCHGYDRCCPQCDSTCRTASTLSTHMWQHIKNQFVRRHVLTDSHKKEFQCKTCDVVTSNKDDEFVHWEKHLRFKDDPSYTLAPYKVGVQAKQALKPGVLRELVASLQDISTKKCCVCSREPLQGFQGRGHLITHLLEDAIANTVDNNLKLKCQVCSKLLDEPVSFKAHIKTHCPMYQCRTCKETFSKGHDLVRHSVVHAKSWACRYCLRRFQMRRMLREHLKSHIETDMMDPTKCPYCEKVFVNRSLFERHKQTAHNPRCPKCTMTFETVGEKNIHLFEFHREGNMYAKCPICAKTYRTFMNLSKHVRSEHGVSMSMGELRVQMITKCNEYMDETDTDQNEGDSNNESKDEITKFNEYMVETDTDQNEVEGNNESKDDIRDMQSKDGDVIESGGEGNSESEEETRDDVERGNISGGGSDVDESSEEECIVLNDADLIVLT